MRDYYQTNRYIFLHHIKDQRLLKPAKSTVTGHLHGCYEGYTSDLKGTSIQWTMYHCSPQWSPEKFRCTCFK